MTEKLFTGMILISQPTNLPYPTLPYPLPNPYPTLPCPLRIHTHALNLKPVAVELRCHATALIAYVKTEAKISCTVTAQLISAFVFATGIVLSLYYLNPKFQASSHLLWLYSPVCVGPSRKPRRQVFLRCGNQSINQKSFTYILFLFFL